MVTAVCKPNLALLMGLLTTLLWGCGGGGNAIVGRVVDLNGKGVPKAEVSTEPPTDLVLTNPRGKFSIRQVLFDDGTVAPIDEGKYVLTIRQLGYEDVVMELDYDGGTMEIPEMEMVPKGMEIDPTAPMPTQEYEHDPTNPQTPVQGT